MDLATGIATIEQRGTGVWDALIYLQQDAWTPDADGHRRPCKRHGFDSVRATVTESGVVALVLSGLSLCYRLPGKQLPGLVALLLGLASCAFLMYGLGALIAT